jgi:hypothetical protein
MRRSKLERRVAGVGCHEVRSFAPVPYGSESRVEAHPWQTIPNSFPCVVWTIDRTLQVQSL